MTVREKIIKAGVRNLKEFGYPACDESNILTDQVYAAFFVTMLDDHPSDAETIQELREEIANNQKAMSEDKTTTATKPAKKKPAAKKSPAVKAPAGKTARQLLAEGAKEIKQAQAASKSVSKNTKVAVVDAVLPKIEIPKGEIDLILAERVTMGKDNASLKISKDTTAGEFIRIFDNIVNLGDKVQFLIGDAINEGEVLPCFEGKFEAALASTGRKLETLKAYAMAARHTPPSMRSVHPQIKYQHLKELVPIQKLEDKKTVLAEAVQAAKDGHPLTTKELRAKAEPFKKPKAKRKEAPAKPQKPGRVIRDITVEETDALKDLEGKAEALEQAIGGAAFVLELKTEETMFLREKLERIARFWDQIK